MINKNILQKNNIGLTNRHCQSQNLHDRFEHQNDDEGILLSRSFIHLQ